MNTPIQQQRQDAFTAERKLHALAFRFYQGQNNWQPKAGDFYTLTRAGVELFQITRIEDSHVYICNCLGGYGEQPGGFPLQGFTSEGFGVNRVQVPDWVFDIPASL